MPTLRINSEFHVIAAKEEHLPVIQQIAYDTWPHTFANILSREQITYMLEWMYNIDSLKDQIHHQGHHFLLAKEKDVFVGFASFEINYKDQAGTKIHKIYILPKHQGKGVGKMLVDNIKDAALHAGNTKLVLNVNRNNKAAEMYKKIGFKVVYEENISIGNGFFMEDFVMEKQI